VVVVWSRLVSFLCPPALILLGIAVAPPKCTHIYLESGGVRCSSILAVTLIGPVTQSISTN